MIKQGFGQQEAKLNKAKMEDEIGTGQILNK